MSFMNAYIILLSCINFYSNKLIDYAYSLYKPPISAVTFHPKYTNDQNLWTIDKLLIKVNNKTKKIEI
jgi:hypothetical protein